MLRALDLFCGAGGASEGLRQAGFDVVGVDIADQPHYRHSFLKADALTVPLRGFDYIWASPPCQAYSKAQRLRGYRHPDLIRLVRRRLRGADVPFWTIENVVGAPLSSPVELCGTMFGLRLYRHRLFESSFAVEAPDHPPHVAPLCKMGRPPLPGEFMHVVGNFSGAAQAREAMGVHWMTRDEMRESIPPAYARFIGAAAINHIKEG